MREQILRKCGLPKSPNNKVVACGFKVMYSRYGIIMYSLLLLIFLVFCGLKLSKIDMY